MKKIFHYSFFLIIILGLSGLVVNAQDFAPKKMLSRAEMTEDLHTARSTLEKYHPFLYRYLPRGEFAKRYDSLLTSLPAEMESSGFYLLACQLFYSLRHGHMLLFPGDPNDAFAHHTLSGFTFEIFDDKIYILRDENGVADIQAGTRLESVNGMDASAMVAKYFYAVPVEGLGESLRLKLLAELFPLFLIYESERTDSLKLALNYLDSGFVVTVSAVQKKSRTKLNSVLEMYRQMIDPVIIEDLSGLYTPEARLLFTDPDRRVALLTVKNFMQPNHEFYRESFRLLDSSGTAHLILDLRDNLGGVLMYAAELMSYLSDSSFFFIDRPVLKSRSQLFYPHGNPLVQYLVTTLFLPVVWALYSPIEKEPEGMFSYNALESRLQKVKDDKFKGSVSVLINGGTYSAASLVAANLKYSGERLVIGEETGGASEGTVAMRLSTLEMPNSGFQLRYGIGYLQPRYKGGEPGRGVMPDIRIIPTLNDRIEGIDPELRYLLEILDRNE